MPESMNTAAQYFMIGMESESRAIARGLRRRDPNLLDRLTEQFQHRLFRYLIYLVGNRELAQDLFQETWIRVLERGHQYDGKHEFSTWLMIIAPTVELRCANKKPLPLIPRSSVLVDDENVSALGGSRNGHRRGSRRFIDGNSERECHLCCLSMFAVEH